MTQLDLQSVEEGVVVKVRAYPGASRVGVTGVFDGAVKVAVTVAPEKGKANKAILSILAQSLDVPRRAVELVGGETSRNKRVLIRGIDAATVARRLDS